MIEHEVIVAFDIDGVLNPFRRRVGAANLRTIGYVEHQVCFPPGLIPHSPLLKHDTCAADAVRRMWLNPAHGLWINELLDTAGVQPIWASPWERAASVIEPLLALTASLPVVEFTRHPCAPAWHHLHLSPRMVKVDVLNMLYPTTPLVWIDDLITQSRVGRTRAGHCPVWRRYQHVDRFTGLTNRDIDQVDDFINWVLNRP